MVTKDMYSAIFLLILSLLAYIESLSYPTDSAYFPRVIIGLLALLSFALLEKSLSTMKQSRQEKGTGEQTKATEVISLFRSQAFKKAILMIAGSVIYLFVLSSVGFYATSLVYLFVMIWLLGVRKIRTILLSTFVVLFFIFLVFSAFLSVPLPEGVVF